MARSGNYKNNSKWQHKNTQSNYVPRYRVVNEVISPISLGMVPVSALIPNAFGDEMQKVSPQHDEKTTGKIVNRSRTIPNSITYPN